MFIKQTSLLFIVCIFFILFFTNCQDAYYTSENAFLAEKGIYVFNTGNENNSVNGSLSFIDKKHDTVLHHVFMNTNYRSLGMIVQDGVILDNYLYIAISGSNTIEVVDKNSLKSIRQIQLNSKQGSTPRDIVTDGQYIYVSMFSGHVSRINPQTISIDQTISVGPNPEEMAIANGHLYVVNSDGLNYQNGYINGKSVSKINLSTLHETKIPVGLNPTQIKADNSGNLLVLCMGDYSSTSTSIWKINNQDFATDLKIPATIITVKENTLYTINAPWDTNEITYKTYDTQSDTLIHSNFISQTVEAPASLSIHPQNGHIFISSYHLVGGYTSYLTSGYIAEYDANGIFIQNYEVGVGPINITFL